MSNTYAVKTSRNQLLYNLAEMRRWFVSENVTLHGRGAENYAFDRNENLVYMMENFAGSPAPSTPLDGQMWWDLSNGALRVWSADGSPQNKWDPVVPGSAGVGFRIDAGQGLKYVGSPVVTQDDIDHGVLPTGSPLTIELEIGTGQTTLQAIVAINTSSDSNSSRVITSIDGVNWTVQSTPAGGSVRHQSIAYSSSLQRFVIQERGSRNIMYSGDGENWTRVVDALPDATGSGGSNDWRKIDWIDELSMFFCANRDNDVTTKIAYSTDGISWTAVPAAQTPVTAAILTNEIEFQWIGGSLNRVVCYLNGPSNFYIAHSVDGITWTDILCHTGNDPRYGYLPCTTWSSGLDEVLSIESSGSSFTTPVAHYYDTAAAGSPLFDSADWTSSSMPFPPLARNGDYQSLTWIDAGSPASYLLVGTGDSFSGSDNIGSPFTGDTNFASSKDGVAWKKIGGILPVADTGPGQDGAVQQVDWHTAKYIPSLDRILAMSIDNGTSWGSPFTYFMQISDPVAGATRNWAGRPGQQAASRWSKVDVPTASFTSVDFEWSDFAFGEVTLTGVSVDANSISIDESTLTHDLLSGFESTEHVDHSTVSVTGAGITGIYHDGFGFQPWDDITVSGQLNCTGGTDIAASASEINVLTTVVRTTGLQGISGVKTFVTPGGVRAPDGTSALPGIAFYTDTDNGMYRPSANTLGFTTAGQGRFIISPNGVLTSLNALYETLVTEDDDIPNKKYIDDVAGGATGAVTENTHVGATNIPGLTPGRRYLVGVYGLIRNNGTGSGTHGGIRITSQIGFPPIAGLLYQGPLHAGINWPDGNAPQFSTAVITAPAGGQIWGYTDYRDNTPPAIEYRNAMYMTAVQID